MIATDKPTQHIKTAQSADAPTSAYFLNFQESIKAAPLLVYFPGLDETGKDLISLQTASFEQDFNVRSLVIPPDDLGDWDELAEAAIALTKAELETLPPGLPVYLCAESFGGCLALKVLLKERNLFDRVILSNSASSFPRVPWLHLGSSLFFLVPEWYYKFSASFTLPFLASPWRLSSAARQALINSTRSAPKHTLQRRLALMREFSIDETQLRQVKQPVLLIGSGQDLILPSVDEAHRLANIFPNATVVTLPHSGHACLVENGVDLNNIMQAERFIVPLAPSV